MIKKIFFRKNKGSAFIFFILMSAVATFTAAAVLSYSMHSSIIIEKGVASITSFHAANLGYDIYQHYVESNQVPGLTDAEKTAFMTKIQTEFFSASGNITELQFIDVTFNDEEILAGTTATPPDDPNDFWSFRSTRNLVVEATIN